MIEEETDSRIFFNKELGKKSSHLESEITNIMSNISNPEFGDLGEKVSLLETTMSKLNDKVSSQPDLEVTTNDNITNDSIYHDSASHSVQKSKQETDLELEESHSTVNNQQRDISNSANETQVSIINNSAKVIEIDLVSKACKSEGKKGIIIKNQPSVGHQIIEGTFGIINNFLKGIFGVIQSFLKSGMGWGIIIIVLLQCTAARAAPMQGNDSLSFTPIAEMNQTTIPEAFSFLGFGSSTIIYAAYTMFSKNYIINLGDAEDRLTKDISGSCNAISTQD